MKRRILLMAAAVLGFCIFAWLVFNPPEPRYQGKPLRVWLEGYNHGPDSPEWQQADVALGHIGVKAVPTLLHLLRAHDSRLKWNLISFVEKQRLFKVKINHIPPSLYNLEASRAFAALGASASNAVPALIEIFEADISPESRQYTAAALGGIGPAAKPAVPALLRGMHHALVWDYGRSIITALGRIHAEPQAVVPALLQRVNDRDAFAEAIYALELYGPEARPAVPALAAILANPNQPLTQLLAAAHSLKQIAPDVYARPETTLPALLKCVEGYHRQARFWALVEIGSFGPAARSAMPHLVPKLVDADPAFLIMVQRAIKQIHPEIQPDPDPAVQALIKLLNYDDAGDQYEAIEALKALGAEAKPAVPALLRLFQGKEDRFRSEAGEALKQIDPEALARARANGPPK